MQECIEKQAEFSGLLTYSGYEIQKWKVLPLPESKDMYDVYYENQASWEKIEVRGYDQIRDTISNPAYKKITLIKDKNGQVERIDGERHILASEGMKFTDLKNTFPHSDISTSVFGSRVDKYVVTEKIRVSENGKE
jgi:hypothetical protein